VDNNQQSNQHIPMIPQLSVLNLLRLKHQNGHIDNSYFELFQLSHVHIKYLCLHYYKNDPGLSKVCSLLLSELLNNDHSKNVDLENWVKTNYKIKRETLNIGWNSDVQHLFV